MAKMSGRRAVKMALAISTEKRGFAAIDSHTHTDTHTAWHEGKMGNGDRGGESEKAEVGARQCPSCNFSFR